MGLPKFLKINVKKEGESSHGKDGKEEAPLPPQKPSEGSLSSPPKPGKREGTNIPPPPKPTSQDLPSRPLARGPGEPSMPPPPPPGRSQEAGPGKPQGIPPPPPGMDKKPTMPPKGPGGLPPQPRGPSMLPPPGMGKKQDMPDFGSTPPPPSTPDAPRHPEPKLPSRPEPAPTHKPSRDAFELPGFDEEEIEDAEKAEELADVLGKDEPIKIDWTSDDENQEEIPKPPRKQPDQTTEEILPDESKEEVEEKAPAKKDRKISAPAEPEEKLYSEAGELFVKAQHYEHLFNNIKDMKKAINTLETSVHNYSVAVNDQDIGYQKVSDTLYSVQEKLLDIDTKIFEEG